MTKRINFERYEHFVDAVTSDASKDFVSLADRLVELDGKGVNIERLLTAGVGINAEGGEFLEIIKKMVFQGKPWNDDNREHLIIELGDLLWYVAQATQALDISFEEVIETNIKKLERRYPGGEFDIYYSENRAEGRPVKDFKIPFAIVSFLLVQGAGAVWWSSQIDGRVRTLEQQSLNIAKENRRYIEQVVQPSYGIGKNWKNQYHDEWVLKGGWK